MRCSAFILYLFAAPALAANTPWPAQPVLTLKPDMQQLVAAEAIIKPAKKGKKKVNTNPYSPENALEKTTSSLVAVMKESALSERRIASNKNQ
mgnify:CR=1 FL=1